MITFCKLPKSTWVALEEADRRRAALLWEFCAREQPIEDLLRATDRYDVRDGKESIAQWWQYRGDSGLLFDHAHGVLGEASQGGFVCRDRELWKAIAKSKSAPDEVSWELDEDGGDEYDPAENMWAPPDVDEIVRAIR